MNRTKATLGALILSVLALCAIGVGNASALTLHECKEFVKPGEGTGTVYKDPKCSEQSPEGKFETIPIPVNTPVELENTLTPTTAGMNVTAGEEAGTHIVLHFVAGGISVIITCTGATGTGQGKNELSGGVMKVSGTGHAQYTGCKIVGSAKAAENCQVPETLETVEVSLTTEEDRVVIKPKEGTVFITIPFTSKAGKTCPAAILGEKQVTGTAKGTVASPTAIEFTGESGSELKLGGIAAQLTVVTHMRTKGTTGETGTVALETP